MAVSNCERATMMGVIPTALLSDSPGIPSGGRFVIHWREEDSRHAISGKIADGFYGR